MNKKTIALALAIAMYAIIMSIPIKPVKADTGTYYTDAYDCDLDYSDPSPYNTTDAFYHEMNASPNCTAVNDGNTGYQLLYVQNALYGGFRWSIRRLMLWFDISADIGVNDTINSAVMSFFCYGVAYSDVFSLKVQNTTITNRPSDTFDYNRTMHAGDLGDISVTTISNGAWFNITLNSAGRAYLQENYADNIPFIVRHSDDIDDTVPPRDEYQQSVLVKSFHNTTHMPRLYLTYTPYVAPISGSEAGIQTIIIGVGVFLPFFGAMFLFWRDDTPSFGAIFMEYLCLCVFIPIFAFFMVVGITGEGSIAVFQAYAGGSLMTNTVGICAFAVILGFFLTTIRAARAFRG